MRNNTSLTGKLLNLPEELRLDELNSLAKDKLLDLDEYSKKLYNNLFNKDSYIRNSTIQEIQIMKFLDRAKRRL